MRSEQQKISEHFFTNAFLAGDLFGDLSAEAQGALAALKREENQPAEEALFRRGEMPHSIFILREGEARIVHQNETYPIEKDEILGLTEALTGQPYATSVRAEAACRIEAIDRAEFLNFLRSHPETCFRLAQMLGANLQRIYRFFR